MFAWCNTDSEMKMIGKIITSIILVGCLNVSLTFLYRRGKLSKCLFTCALVLANVLGIYISQIIMGVPTNSWFPVILALIGGTSGGFQGARVIIRIGHLEKANAQSHLDNDKEAL
jgi:hypothetical protein